MKALTRVEPLNAGVVGQDLPQSDNEESSPMNQDFQAHLDICAQCFNHPLELCPLGGSLLYQGVLPPSAPARTGETTAVDVPCHDAICPKCGHYFETDIPEKEAANDARAYAGRSRDPVPDSTEAVSQSNMAPVAVSEPSDRDHLMMTWAELLGYVAVLKHAAAQAVENLLIAKDFLHQSGTDPETFIDDAIDGLKRLREVPAPVVTTPAGPFEDWTPEFTVYLVRFGPSWPWRVESVWMDEDSAKRRAAVRGAGWHVQRYSHIQPPAAPVLPVGREKEKEDSRTRVDME